jgi:hypothetical protein
VGDALAGWVFAAAAPEDGRTPAEHKKEVNIEQRTPKSEAVAMMGNGILDRELRAAGLTLLFRSVTILGPTLSGPTLSLLLSCIGHAFDDDFGAANGASALGDGFCHGFDVAIH